jgi:hypothetical protein
MRIFEAGMVEQLLSSEEKNRYVLLLVCPIKCAAPLDVSQLRCSGSLRLSARAKRLLNQSHAPPTSQRQHVLFAELPCIVGLLLVSCCCCNIFCIFCCTHCHSSLQNAQLCPRTRARRRRLKSGSWYISRHVHRGDRWCVPALSKQDCVHMVQYQY